MNEPEHPRDEPPGELARGRARSREARSREARLSLALLVGLVTLPARVAASPPEPASPFADLPSPDDLPDLLEPAAASEPKPAPRSSPPKTKSNDGDDAEPEPEPDDDDASEEAEAGEEIEAQEPALQVKTLAKARWIKHLIIPGERIDEIAARYQVRKASLIRWNKLDPDKPRIYAGRQLAVYTKFIPPPQQQLVYTVKRGDNWTKIAKAHRVDPDHLRLRWNPKVPRKFKAGQQLVIWIDPLEDPDLLRDANKPRTKASGTSSSASGVAEASSSAGVPAAQLPLVKISTGSVSVGKPNRGKIVNGIRLPENKQLYTIRKPDESWGSSHTLHNLQLAIASWRHATGFSGALVIGALSKKGGGRLKPHSSHQSGRDVDIRLPLSRAGGESENTADVDWDATWALIQALVATGEVQYIFLSTSRQEFLHKAAKRAGASKDMIERLIQYPRKSGTNNGIVRDAKGHTAHFHVRFTCAANETRCESY